MEARFTVQIVTILATSRFKDFNAENETKVG